MAENKIPTSTYELGLVELQKNVLFAQMSEEEKNYYVTESLKIGAETAKKVYSETEKIVDAINNEKIGLIKKPAHKYSGDILLRGDIFFTKKKCEITYYEDSVESIYQMYNSELPKDLQIEKDLAEEIHLSHEYFHYLEFKSGEMVSEQLNKLETKGLFGKRKFVEILECSEIAAHSFAKEFCKLKVLPNYYDLQYIYQKNKK